MPKNVKIQNKKQGKGKGATTGAKKQSKPKTGPSKKTISTSLPTPLSDDKSKKPARKPDQPKKLKLRDQKYIPIPESAFLSSKSQGKKRARDDDGEDDAAGEVGSGSGSDEDEDSEVDHGMIIDGEEEETLEFLNGGGASFLAGLDAKVLSRTAKESERLHQLDKQRNPLPETTKKGKHPAIDEDDEDLESLTGSDLDDLDSEDLEDLGSDDDVDMEDSEEDETAVKGMKAAGKGKAKLGGEEYPVEEDGCSSADEDGDEDEDEDLDSELDDSDLSLSDDDSEDMDSASDSREETTLVRKRNKRDTDGDGLEDQYLSSAGNKRRKLAAKAEGNDEEKEHTDVGHLPIKLANGEIQKVEGTTRITLPPPKKPANQPKGKKEPSSDTETDFTASDAGSSDEDEKVDRLASTKGKFGRMGIVDILVKDLNGMKGREKSGVRLGMAKEQIARIGAEITGGGELIDLIPLLTRLSTFGLAKIRSMDENNTILEVPNSIRGLAFLSQLAVYKDLIPGYRIRELTATEEAEKVRDEVRRLREGEKGLVKSYKGYLKNLEAEVKARSPLASVSLKCMCDLLVSAPQFNFAENLMGVIVGRLSKRSWDNDSEQILQTIITVFRNDTSSQQSAVLLRLIARMIKERHYNVNPNVMRCLLHLRLRSELGQMRVKGKGRGPDAKERAEIKAKSETRKKWMNKNRKRAEEERKEIEKELNEASAEVDKEERAIIQTETLKNLFVLYFSIIKQPKRSPMLAAAMEGISKYAHLVNIEFFRDLLAVLKNLVKNDITADDNDDEEDASAPDVVGTGASVRLKMLGIVTAFELLSGQGEALNLDLNEFITQLYALLQPLSLDTNIESAPKQPKSGKDDNKGNFDPTARIKKVPTDLSTTADLMFRCLHLIFFSKHVHSSNSPPWRAAAFAKRLLECALQFPPTTAMKAVQFVQQLVARESKLEAFLSSDDRTADGIYRPDLNDPQLANSFATSFWELGALERDHWDSEIRERAGLLANGHLI